jgi:hypothetical protein
MFIVVVVNLPIHCHQFLETRSRIVYIYCMSWRLMVKVKHPSFTPPSSLEEIENKNNPKVSLFSNGPTQ